MHHINFLCLELYSIDTMAQTLWERINQAFINDDKLQQKSVLIFSYFSLMAKTEVYILRGSVIFYV